MRIKNIFKEKFKKHKQAVAEEYLPKIKEYDVHSAYIEENGTDIVNGEERPYLIMKIYMEESNTTSSCRE